MRTAAALIIGNEILTGKVEEANVGFLARELFELGIALRRVIVCPDERDVIVDDLNALRAAHDYVFTSGGVGPTHDDITIASVAHAFGREVVRSAEVERLIREWHREKDRPITDDHLRMADSVEGARLVRGGDVAWPTIVVENVYVMPGVPEVFRLKFTALRAELDQGKRFHNHTVYTHCDEGQIAALLTSLTKAHPRVVIGSYLAWRDPEYKTRITFDAESEADAKAAADALIAGLDDDQVVKRAP